MESKDVKENAKRQQLIELEKRVRVTVDNFVNVLYNLPPSNSDVRRDFVLGVKDAYVHQLKDLGLSVALVETLSSYSYVLFELNQKCNTPDNLEMLSFVVQYQIRVEHYLRDFLKVQVPLFPWTAFNENQKWTFKDYIDIWKQSDSSGDKALRHGVREVGDIRNKFAHRLNYKLELKDIRKIKAYIDSHKDWFPGCDLFTPIDHYRSFCYAACIYFHNRTWQLTDWEWKIEPKNNLPDWPDVPHILDEPEYEI